MLTTSIIFLAGGKGSRMNSATPKQYLPLQGKPLFQHSLDLFLSLGHEIIVVADPAYHALFTGVSQFALPGKERQDSVYCGLMKVQKESQFVLIHDSARPFVTLSAIQDVLQAGYEYGAATLASPLTFTVKEGKDGFVHKTLDRSTLFEIQTPQVIAKPLLMQGFDRLQQKKLLVTDDVSLVELLGHPVKLVIGSPGNKKITTPYDLA